MAGDLEKSGLQDNTKKILDILNESNYAYTVEAKNISVHTPKIDPKQAKLEGKSLACAVYGDLLITDRKTDKTKEYPHMHLYNMPVQTDLGTYIVKGVEYNTVKQLQKLPGVYYRFSAGKPVAVFYTARKSNFKILYDPQTLKFVLYYNGTLPLYPILKYLGYTDDELKKAWGKGILEANAATSITPEVAAERLYSKMFFSKKETDPAKVRAGILQQFEMSTIDPHDVKNFLNIDTDHISPELLVAATQAMLEMADGKIAEHDGNDIYSMHISDVDDYILHRLSTANINPYSLGNTLRKVYEGKITLYGVIQKIIDGTFTTFEMSNVFNQTNPVAMLANKLEVTKMGPGAIGSPEAVTLGDSDLRANYAGALDPAKTPESHNVGLTLYMTPNVKKGPNGEIEIKLYDVKRHSTSYVPSYDLAHAYVAFPGQYDIDGSIATPKHKSIKVYYENDIKTVPPSKVNYIIPQGEDMFNYATLLSPYMNTDQGNRLLMAGKHVTQALPLKYNEPPKVQVALPNSKLTLEKTLPDIATDGRELSHWNGYVVSVSDKYIKIKDENGVTHSVYIYHNYPLNGNVYFNEIPVVSPRNKVKVGQRILTNNFMRDNTLALGTNLKVAYIPYKGYNYEDGAVISESAAKKLTSTHMYTYTHRIYTDKAGSSDILSKAKYVAAYPDKYNAGQLKNIGDNGIVKAGSTVQPDDPLALILHPATSTYEDKVFGTNLKILKNRYVDNSIIWDHDTPGTVENVVSTPKQLVITVRTEEPAVVGDKITGRHGNKGIIAAIIPDEKMPADKNGNRPDVLLSPLGIVSRINPGQLYETVAGKVADKTGKVIKVRPFTPDRYKEVTSLAKKYGVDVNTPLKYDDQKDYKPVLAGTQYIYKLDQSVSHKLSGVGNLAPYSAVSGQPTRTDSGNPQSLDHLTLYGLLAHGAGANLHEMATYKSDEDNKEYWRAVELGLRLPPPKTPVSLQKFVNMLRGSGIDVDTYGNTFELVPLTDKAIKKLAPKKLAHPEKTLRAKDLKPIAGGLYDLDITGGLHGDGWSRIALSQSIPNPVFEKAIKLILKQKYDIGHGTFEKLLSGEVGIDPKTKKVVTTGGLRRDKAFNALLDFDPNTFAQKLRKELATSKDADYRDPRTRALKYMMALSRLGYRPNEAYMIKNLPVVPPNLRPIYTDKEGKILIPDINALYKDVGLINKELGEMKKGPAQLKNKLYSDLYKSVAAAEGWGDPISNAELKGVGKTIIGSAPKAGFFQKKLIDRRQLTSGRSTITPDPTLGIDQVGIPTEMAWNIYRPYIIRQLIAQGFKAIDAVEEWKKRTPTAYRAMELAISKRPVLLNRAPTLHKWGILAFKPKLVKGKHIRVNQLVVKPFNADFDGDTMAVHVPSTQEAVEEAKKLYPSRNMVRFGEEKIFILPQTEVLLGIYMMSLVTGNSPKGNFSTVEDALAAYRAHKISLNQETKIHGVRTSLGNYLLANAIPAKYREYNKAWDKDYIQRLFSRMYREDPADAARSLDKIKELSNEYGTELRSSIDFHDLRPELNLSKKLDTQEGIKSIEKTLSKQKRSFPLFASKGIRGKLSQTRQILVGPGQVASIRGVTYDKLHTPYAYGLDPVDYYKTMYGARQGGISRSRLTRDPGAFNKELAANYVPLVITRVESDDKGREVPLSYPNLTRRFLARDVVYKKHVLAKRGELITPRLLGQLRKRRIKKVYIMSPLTDPTVDGMAAKSFGLTADGKLLEHGTNIGLLAVHSITEPLSQGTLNVFHTGGLKKRDTGLDYVWSLFRGVSRVDDAVLAQDDGKITKIEKMQKGGYKIYLDGDPYICPFTNHPIVKVGQVVKRGDALTDGHINQRELMELKGPEPTREYLLEQLKRAMGPQYKDDRFLEVLVRGATSRVVVTDPGDNIWLAKGELAPLNYIQEINRTKEAKIPVSYSLGSVVAEPIKEIALHRGKRITKKDIEKMKANGVDEVTVKASPIKYKHVILNSAKAPIYDPDWMSALNFAGLSQVLRNSVATNGISNAGKGNPIPRYIQGKPLY